MKGPRLFRIVLQVKDLARATDFYAELLGAPGRSVGGGRVYFDCGASIVALIDTGAPPRPTAEDVYFAVPDLDDLFNRAQALRCLSDEDVHGEDAGEIIERPWGERSFYVVDPWGNGLCFVDQETVFTGEATRA
jgi:catechol 2,3-dioxygenase-like lactoylglutathione lyase family enzyme